MSAPSRLDSLDMFGAAAGLAEQVEVAAASAAALDGLPSAEGIRSVAVLGMGGSGIGGDLLAAVSGSRLPVPVVVPKGYEAPAFVGPDTLVFAVSFSGNTEETISAASSAAERGARIVVIAAGGEMARLAGEWGAPVVPIAAGIPMPRAGIGAVAIPPLVILERLGLLEGISAEIAGAAEQLRRRRDQLTGTDSVAATLARHIGRTMPIVYGGGALGEVAAARWKGQFNENTKIPSFANRIPELTHNEICGWGQHGDVTRQVFSLLLLRHSFEHPQTRRRFAMVAEIMDEVVAGVHQVEAEGDSILGQLLDLVLLGDFVSLELAAQSGVDPGPVPILDQIKAALRA